MRRGGPARPRPRGGARERVIPTCCLRRISVAKLKGAPEKFVLDQMIESDHKYLQASCLHAVGSKPESLALVFLWFRLTEKELRTKLRRRKMTEEAINEHIKNARERLPGVRRGSRSLSDIGRRQ